MLSIIKRPSKRAPNITPYRSASITNRAGKSVPGRSIVVNLRTTPALQVIGMYVPNRGIDPTKVERKRVFMDEWLSILTNDVSSNQQHRILLGDLNIVPTGQNPRFLPQEYFEYDWYEKLERQAGLYDAALRHNPPGL